MFKRIAPLLYIGAGETKYSDALDLGGDNALRIEGMLINNNGTFGGNKVTVAVEISNDSVNWSAPSSAITFDLAANPSYGSADSDTGIILSRFVRLKFSDTTTGDSILSAWINTSRRG